MTGFGRPVLVLDASSGASARGGARCLAAIVTPGAGGHQYWAICAQAVFEGPGGATRLAPALPPMLREAGLALTDLGGIACVSGPGSFTGLRATLALAQGLCDGLRLPLVTVTVGEAFGVDADPGLYVATMARRGRVFVERHAQAPVSFDLIDGAPAGWAPPARVAGDGAEALAALWPETTLEIPDSNGPAAQVTAAAAARRLAGELPPRPALPLYVDAPEAKLPAAAAAPIRADG